uniref:Prostate-associated microseminoprotein n=1 Tax=Electrophorus electricus TaxID=8005 RepID=A0AAY5F0T5_ELEEL
MPCLIVGAKPSLHPRPIKMCVCVWGGGGGGGVVKVSSLLSPSTALCEYKGRRYSLGDSWMEQGCVQCTCLHPVGVGCCETSVVHWPVDFPPWCEVRVESPMCKVTLVLASDPRLPCIPGEGNSVDPSHGSMNMKLAG